LIAKSSLLVQIAPPSPKHPKFFEGKNEVHPISPIDPVFTIEPLSRVMVLL
jgi:hypothetical protein